MVTFFFYDVTIGNKLIIHTSIESLYLRQTLVSSTKDSSVMRKLRRNQGNLTSILKLDLLFAENIYFTNEEKHFSYTVQKI